MVKTAKPRKVFGRRQVKVDGKDFAIEMRKDCVTVRQKWGRVGRRLSLLQLVDMAYGQLALKL